MKLKTTKKALALLLSTTMLVGCFPQEDPTNVPKYTDENKNEISKEEYDKLRVKYENNNDVKEYFEKKEKELEKSRNNEPLERYKEKCLNLLIEYGEFFIEGKPKAGHYFSDLTDNGKKTVVDMSMKVDSVIMEYFPEYKEYISIKIVGIMESTKDMTIDVIGEDNYIKFGLKKDELIEKGKDLYAAGKDKIIEEYKQLKNKSKAK